jgi:hypothetical protein
MSILKTALANVSPNPAEDAEQAFQCLQVEPFVHSLIFGKGLSPADTITPSAHRHEFAHAAKSALGGSSQRAGLYHWAGWSLCALAHGQKKLSSTAGRSACCQCVRT